MDYQELVNLALLALQGILGVIGKIKAQSGLTDDQIMAQAQAMSGANDTLFATLQASLKALPPVPTPPAAI